jgi:hypothetical protein
MDSNLLISIGRANAARWDFVYHMAHEFFGFVNRISLDSVNNCWYYDIVSVNGDLIGSFPFNDFMTASRC